MIVYPDPDAPAMTLAAWLQRDFPAEARTIAEFIRRKVGASGINVDDIGDSAPDAYRGRALGEIRKANAALVAFANTLYPLEQRVRGSMYYHRKRGTIAIHPATTAASRTDPLTGDLVFVIVRDAVVVHVPIGVTVSGQTVKVGDTVRAGMAVMYSKFVLEAGGQDLSFEAEFWEKC